MFSLKLKTDIPCYVILYVLYNSILLAIKNIGTNNIIKMKCIYMNNVDNSYTISLFLPDMLL